MQPVVLGDVKWTVSRSTNQHAALSLSCAGSLLVKVQFGNISYRDKLHLDVQGWITFSFIESKVKEAPNGYAFKHLLSAALLGGAIQAGCGAFTPGVWVYHLPVQAVSAPLEAARRMDSRKINWLVKVRGKTKTNLSASGKSDSPTESRVRELAWLSITRHSLHTRSRCFLSSGPRRTSIPCTVSPWGPVVGHRPQAPYRVPQNPAVTYDKPYM